MVLLRRCFHFAFNLGLLGLMFNVANIAEADDKTTRHVIVISVDGLPAYLFDDPNASMKTIRGLAANGAVAAGMTVSNPSVTWPNHTSLVTGVRPEKHGVLFNGVLEKAGPGLPINVNPHKTKSELVRVRTVVDVAHEQGLRTAGINWPCTRNSGTLDVDFPDSPDTFQFSTPEFLDSLKQANLLSDEMIGNFTKYSVVKRDEIWTDAVCHVIREQKPHLVLFHPLNVDAVHHRYGPQTWAGYSAVAFADACIRRVLDAVDNAGIRDTTTIFVVSDHGFNTIPKTLQPNVVLRQAGLLTVEANKVTATRAHVFPEGGIGMLYLTVPEKKEEDRNKVVELFGGLEGIDSIVLPDEFAKYGLPQPDEYEQMADIILVAKPGYGFSGTATGDEFVIPSTNVLGTHGFLSTDPRMNATFVVSGAGITPGVTLPVINNIDVAPTVARLLGLTLDDVDGRVLTEVLDDSNAK
ncbi:MAG: alkaline phosphatase family protein [Planctomycetota bacterium]|nr:alkaline phosphatase family protein [Planctomycetota bacterium]MDA1211515.1 alkaline phosphatase family protein [Planctomycetota bacterium]